jgi:hypothetical protein
VHGCCAHSRPTNPNTSAFRVIELQLLLNVNMHVPYSTGMDHAFPVQHDPLHA